MRNNASRYPRVKCNNGKGYKCHRQITESRALHQAVGVNPVVRSPFRQHQRTDWRRAVELSIYKHTIAAVLDLRIFFCMVFLLRSIELQEVLW